MLNETDLWDTVISDELKIDQYADDFRKGVFKYPSFTYVVRGAIAFIKEHGNRQKNSSIFEETTGSRTVEVIWSLYKLLSKAGCDLWNLSEFLDVTDISMYYNCLKMYLITVKASSPPLSYFDIRYHLIIILSELNRVKSSRYCLQVSSSPIVNGSVHISMIYCKQYVSTITESTDHTLSCYTCYLLGYSMFYSLNWTEALNYWNSSCWEKYKWDQDDLTVLIDCIKQSAIPEEAINKNNDHSTVDWSSVSVLPCELTLFNHEPHKCLVNTMNPPSLPLIFRYLRFHLMELYRQSNYFSNLEFITDNKEMVVCLMMCFYHSGLISEMLCLNQHVQMCSDMDVIVKSNDFDKELIQYIYDMSLLEFLIHEYSERRSVSERAEEIYNELLKQLQKPEINAFNDESIFASERINQQKRFLRFLFFKFVSLSSF